MSDSQRNCTTCGGYGHLVYVGPWQPSPVPTGWKPCPTCNPPVCPTFNTLYGDPRR